MIEREVKRTPWAVPTVSLQPKGNVTLITLPVFPRADFPNRGYEPGEIRSTTLLGYDIRIRPKLVGYTYDFGDGKTVGPTLSPGGTWPDGAVKHAYASPGEFTFTVSAVYGAEFSVEGDTWVQIDDTATVSGESETVTVREARAQLIPVDD